MVKKKEGDGCDAMDGPERQAGCVDMVYTGMIEEREKRSWPRDRDCADVADTPGVSTVGTSRQRRLPPKTNHTRGAGPILLRCPLQPISLLLHLIET